MDTGAFPEGLSRLYAELAESIRDSDSESVRYAYKQLRNSGRPITEILNEAIRTIGVSYEEIEKHLLGENDSKPVTEAHGIERSVLLEPAFPELDIKPDTPTTFDDVPAHGPDTALFVPPSLEFSVELAALRSSKHGALRIITAAISDGFYVRLAVWAFVVGMIGFVLVSVVQILTVSSAGTSKLSATTKILDAAPINTVEVPAAQKSGGAVADPGAPAKPDAETSAAQPATQAKAEAIDENASKPPGNLEPITIPAAGSQALAISSDVAGRSAGLQNEAKPVEPPQPAAAHLASNTPAGRASNETGSALNAPALPPGGEPAADTSLLLARGDSLFRVGDVVSARGFYERAADKGSGQAALRLGESYDPSFLQQAHLRSVRADTSAAALWYRRARDLGVTEAQILLKDVKGE